MGTFDLYELKFCFEASTNKFYISRQCTFIVFYVTEYGTALTTILPILFLYLNTVTMTAGTFES